MLPPKCAMLVAVGRQLATDSWGFEATDLDMGESPLDVEERCRTSMRAISDVTGEPMRSHRASAQGAMAAEIVDRERCD